MSVEELHHRRIYLCHSKRNHQKTLTQMELKLYQTETYSVISFILISIMALASIAIIYLVKKEIDKSENEIINLKKLYDESKFFTCRETTQNNVEIHQKTEDEPFSLQ